MNAIHKLSDAPEAPFGSPMPGGFYGGRILIANIAYALIVAPKAVGEVKPIIWNDSYAEVTGALSYFDGLANTHAMADAGSKLAARLLALQVDGCSDYYLVSQDELEVIYRNLKPTKEPNSQWGRSGINVSAIPPTYPYSPAVPAQTVNPLFQAGGAEAFEAEAYWTSTQGASGSDYAWRQDFHDGDQHDWGKHGELRARAVRRLAF